MSSKRLSKVLLSQREILASAGETPGNFRRRYTLDELEAVYDASGGRCAICNGDGGKRRLGLDHCHDTGRLRGLLCSRCNTALGMFGDKVEVMEAAIAYLKR